MPEAREWTVASWSSWTDKETGETVRDMHGNYKGSVTFEEDRAEPIDATFKNPPANGEKKYGVVDLYTTKAGRVRKGFKGAQRPIPAPVVPPHQAQDRQPFKADPDRQSDIKGEWAIRLVAEQIGIDDLKKVERIGRELYQMVDKVKKPDLMPDPLNSVFPGNEQYEGDPNSIPFYD